MEECLLQAPVAAVPTNYCAMIKVFLAFCAAEPSVNRTR